MPEHKTANVLRFVNILLLLLQIFLFFMLYRSNQEREMATSIESERKTLEQEPGARNTEDPVFNPHLVSLFPKLPVPAVREKAPVKETQHDEEPPTLHFVGMIETSEKVVYSFRNLRSGRILILEPGVANDGLTIVAVDDTAFTFQKENIKFQVVKK